MKGIYILLVATIAIVSTSGVYSADAKVPASTTAIEKATSVTSNGAIIKPSDVSKECIA